MSGAAKGHIAKPRGRANIRRMESQAAYSHRADPAVPAFPDTGPVIFVDGDCGLCSVWAKIVARHDRTGAFRICPVQSPLGRAVLIHYGIDPDDPQSWLFLDHGHPRTGMEGIAAACRRLGPLRLLAPLLLLPPRPLRDWLYERMARNRYAVFGRTDLCALPDPELRRRLIG